MQAALQSAALPDLRVARRWKVLAAIVAGLVAIHALVPRFLAHERGVPISLLFCFTELPLAMVGFSLTFRWAIRRRASWWLTLLPTIGLSVALAVPTTFAAFALLPGSRLSEPGSSGLPLLAGTLLAFVQCGIWALGYVLPFVAEGDRRATVRHRGLRPLRRRPSAQAPTRPLEEPPVKIVGRRGKSLVFLSREEVFAFEASERLTFVHTSRGRFDVDLSLAAIETSLGAQFTRVHRGWLVDATRVLELDREGHEMRVTVGARPTGPTALVPVAREKAQLVKEMLLSSSMGIRRK